MLIGEANNPFDEVQSRPFAGLTQGDSLAAVFWRNVFECSGKEALWDEHRRNRFLTWQELGWCVARTCQWLDSLQLPPHSRVATQWTNSLAWLAVDLACHTLGYVHVPFDVRESAVVVAQLQQVAEAHRLDQADADFHQWATQADESLDLLQNLRDRAALVLTHAPAQLLATSGTTGCPKLVTLSHCNLISNAWAKLDAAPQTPDDTRLNILPFAHAYARTCELTAWLISRSKLVIARDWDDFLALGVQLQPTLINLVPYLADRFAGLERSTCERFASRLRLLQVGGAALHEQLWQQLAEQGWPPLQGYGLTEASPVVCSNRAGVQQPGSVGPAVHETQLKIDEEGVLWLRGPQVMLGYWGDPVATAQVTEQGWLCTGDIAVQDSTGIRIVGRKSQLLVLSTGYKVSPEFIERKLLSLGDIEQAVVLGDGCPHITAWLRPKRIALPDIAGSATAPESEQAGQRIALQEWLHSLPSRIAAVCRDLPRHAIPKDLRWLEHPLSFDAGTLTRKGTPNRQELERLLGGKASRGDSMQIREN